MGQTYLKKQCSARLASGLKCKEVASITSILTVRRNAGEAENQQLFFDAPKKQGRRVNGCHARWRSGQPPRIWEVTAAAWCKHLKGPRATAGHWTPRRGGYSGPRFRMSFATGNPVMFSRWWCETNPPVYPAAAGAGSHLRAGRPGHPVTIKEGPSTQATLNTPGFYRRPRGMGEGGCPGVWGRGGDALKKVPA